MLTRTRSLTRSLAVPVDIREYYDDGGTKKPGKKGIALTQQQWEKVKDLIPKMTHFLPPEALEAATAAAAAAASSAASAAAASSPASGAYPPSPDQ